jgi:hypothetical protein
VTAALARLRPLVRLLLAVLLPVDERHVLAGWRQGGGR